MKLFVRFLLIFSLLFLGRYEYLYAFTASHGTALTIKSSQQNKDSNERLKAIEVTEEDDDDKLNSFRHLVSGDKIPSFYYAPSPEYTTVHTVNTAPLGKHILYIAPYKYILFGVFRI